MADTIIIGAGQSGLVMSQQLRDAGHAHVVLERNRIAERWRSERWDSLRFQYPNWSLRLPGKTYAGSEPDAYAHHADIIRFLTDYAEQIAAPVREGVAVTRLSAGDGGTYLLDTSAGPLVARNVVLATGPFQRAFVPDLAKGLPVDMLQLDAAAYRNPQALPPGAVLVVGSGASGCQIADELNAAGRRVYLSASRHRRVPRRYRGRDMIWWFERMGRFDVTINSFPGGKYPPSTVVTGVGGGYDVDLQQLARDGVCLLGRVSAIIENKVKLGDDLTAILDGADQAFAAFITAAEVLAERPEVAADLLPAPGPQTVPASSAAHTQADRTQLDLAEAGIGSVIWATGHKFDLGWVDLPVFDAAGRPDQVRGVTACEGLYFLGLHWMHTFKSGQLAYVAEDAAHVARHLLHRA